MRSILENGPFKDEPDFLIRYPLSSQSATFSTKLKTPQKTEAPNLPENDPFPYLFDGRYMSKDHETSLEGIPPHLLVGGNMLAIKTNMSSYTIAAKDDSPARLGYSYPYGPFFFLAMVTALSLLLLPNPPRNGRVSTLSVQERIRRWES